MGPISHTARALSTLLKAPGLRLSRPVSGREGTSGGIPGHAPTRQISELPRRYRYQVPLPCDPSLRERVTCCCVVSARLLYCVPRRAQHITPPLAPAQARQRHTMSCSLLPHSQVALLPSNCGSHRDHAGPGGLLLRKSETQLMAHRRVAPHPLRVAQQQHCGSKTSCDTSARTCTRPQPRGARAHRNTKLHHHPAEHMSRRQQPACRAQWSPLTSDMPTLRDTPPPSPSPSWHGPSYWSHTANQPTPPSPQSSVCCGNKGPRTA